MSKDRMEAFSDGVVAILITIMVLGLAVPHGGRLDDLVPLAPVFLSYVLGFVNLAIWWNNHHHLLQAAHHVDGRILWANFHLLFWLSLVPWTTAWMGENDFASLPVAAVGADLLLAGFAYYLLVRALIAHEGRQSTIAVAIGRDVKGAISPVLYLTAIPIAFVAPWVSVAIYVAVAAIWFVPDLRIERRITDRGHEHEAAGD
ncbi:MAG TPA: TMEM175 family protein [Candidatus Limnocylindrales bacterium]|nr:TMEM175 family protein [Candidatus Limnocylindrales bacterium]